LEIGVLNGKSLKMWKEFYTNSTVIGLDIDSKCSTYANANDNIFVEIGSQVDETFLKEVSQKYGPFDLIIDDGTHMQNHMIFTFKILFDFLKSQGVYIVEDTPCSYWREYGGGLYNKDSSIEYFKSLVDHINFFGQRLTNHSRWWLRREDLHIEQLKESNPNNIRTDIESINFINSSILVTKR
jgi:hypothetical protein